MFYIFWFGLIFIINQSSCIEDIILREEQGTVFKKIFQIDNSAIEWTHTFVLPYFKPWNVTIRENECENLNVTDHEHYNDMIYLCGELQQYMKEYDSLLKQSMLTIEDNENKIRKLLPEQLAINRGQLRTKRAPFEFIADISNALFGTASEKQLKILAKHVVAIENGNKNSLNNLQHNIDELHSYQITVNDRIGNLKKAIEESQNIITTLKWAHQRNDRMMKAKWNSLYRGMSFRVHHLKQSVRLLHAYNVQFLKFLSTLYFDSNDRVTGIQRLLQGYLDVNIIPPNILEEVLNNVQNILRDRYVDFELVNDNIVFYYSRPLTGVLHTKDNLYVKINIPIQRSSTLFNVFKVENIPQPHVFNNTNVLTRLNLPSHFAISKDLNSFIELDPSDLLDCKGNFIKHCNNELIPRLRSSASCVSSIFLDHKAQVEKLCETDIILKPKINWQSVSSLGSSKYFISTFNTEWLLSCPGGHVTKIKGKPYSIVKVNCACQLQSNNFVITSSTNECNQLSSDSTVSLGTKEFAWSTEHFSIQIVNNDRIGDKIENFSFELGNIMEFKKNFDYFMTKDAELAVSLKSFERQAKAKINFPMIDNPLTLFNGGWETSKSTSYILYGLSYLSIAVLGSVVYILFRRSEHLKASFMTIAQLLDKAEASEMDSLFTVKSDVLIILWILMSIAVILFILLLIWKSCVKVIQNSIVQTNDEHCTLQNLSTSVYLGLYGQDKQRAIKLATIPVTLSDLHDGVIEPVKDIHLSWCHLQCNLAIDWKPLEGLFTEVSMFKRLPTQTSITYFDYFFINNLLKKGFLLKIIFKQNEKSLIVCQTQIPSNISDSPLTKLRSLRLPSNIPEPTDV